MREIRTHGLKRGPPHRKNLGGVLYSTKKSERFIAGCSVARVPRWGVRSCGLTPGESINRNVTIRKFDKKSTNKQNAKGKRRQIAPRREFIMSRRHNEKRKQRNATDHSEASGTRIEGRSRMLSIEGVENRIANAKRAVYEKAIKESRELFDLSLKIDDKVKAGVHDIHVRMGWYVGILSFAVIVAGSLGLPKISEWYTQRIEEKVTEKYVGMAVQKHLTEFTDTKVSVMVATSVSNTEGRIKREFTQYMKNQVVEFNRNIGNLESRIEDADAVINLYETCASARAGDRKDYELLVTLASGTNRIAHIASSTVDGIKKSYEQIKNTLGKNRVVLVDVHDVKKLISEDVMIFAVHEDSIGRCDGAINSLADKNNQKFVATLIFAVRHSKHLDFVYVAIRGIEKLTGQTFPALGIQESLNWWNTNKSNELYHCAFERYIEAQMLPGESPDDYGWRKAEYLDEWIRGMPNQYFAASRIPPLILFAKVDTEKEVKRKEMLDFAFEYWGKESLRANDWYVFRTIYLARYDTGEIIDFINQRLKEHPEFEDELKQWQFVFNPEFFELAGINWPSKQSNNGPDEQDEKK